MKKKVIVVDTSTIISLASNNLLWLLEPLRKRLKGDFYIPPGVKYEIIDRPLQSKRFKLEAMQVLMEVSKGNIKVYPEDFELDRKTRELERLSNNIFKAHENFMHITHYGEISVIALAAKLNADAILIDERTTRVLLEDPFMLVELLQSRLHMPIQVDENNMKKFYEKATKAPVMRSTELAVIAFEMGLFDKFSAIEKQYIVNPKMNILDALLWSLKLKGCAISNDEIDELLKLEGFTALKKSLNPS